MCKVFLSLSQPSPLSFQGGSVIIPLKEGETEVVRGEASCPRSQLGEGRAGPPQPQPQRKHQWAPLSTQKEPHNLRDYGNQTVKGNGKTLTKISVKNIL